MKICVYGVGAIGGWVATRFEATDHELSCVDRSDICAVLLRDGVHLTSEDSLRKVNLPVTDCPVDLGEQDLVIIAVRSMELVGIVESLQPLLGKDTAVITLCEGVPWWYLYKHKHKYKPEQDWLDAVDPNGAIWAAIGPERALGCIAYPSINRKGPGVIEHQFGSRFLLGEPDGSKSKRSQKVQQAFVDAGLRADVVSDIRSSLWLRIMASTAFSLISVLTSKKLDVMFSNYRLRREIVNVMNDIVAVAKSLGVTPSMTPKELLDVSVLLGEHKTLMLQDLEGGRQLEIGTLVTAVQELGRNTGVATDKLDTVVELAAEIGRSAGCYPKK